MVVEKQYWLCIGCSLLTAHHTEEVLQRNLNQIVEMLRKKQPITSELISTVVFINLTCNKYIYIYLASGPIPILLLATIDGDSRNSIQLKWRTGADYFAKKRLTFNLNMSDVKRQRCINIGIKTKMCCVVQDVHWPEKDAEQLAQIHVVWSLLKA